MTTFLRQMIIVTGLGPVADTLGGRRKRGRFPHSGRRLVRGNIDMKRRPAVKNPDGSVSSVRSISIGEDDVEVLIPTVSDDGRIMSNDEAIASYKKSGKHLGKYRNIAAANRFARRIHESEERKLNRANRKKARHG
jgi:hypothetical protein